MKQRSQMKQNFKQAAVASLWGLTPGVTAYGVTPFYDDKRQTCIQTVTASLNILLQICYDVFGSANVYR